MGWEDVSVCLQVNKCDVRKERWRFIDSERPESSELSPSLIVCLTTRTLCRDDLTKIKNNKLTPF